MAKYIRTEEGYKTATDIGIAASEQVDLKMNANNPVGTGSFSMGRKPGTVIGVYSHAEGSNTTASGYYSHSEGWDTTASNQTSHAEGSNTIASGLYSHAEGFWTTAKNESQHVQGEFNILDTEGTENIRGKYAHIVGNGISSSNRSNAHTLDWQGNAWYQGDVYVGSTSGTNKDEGSKKLATEEYVDTSIASVVNSAPETLNTLNELAAALGNDENFATTVATQIGTKIDKIDGKGLSSNDYDSETKTFVDTLKTKNLATQEIVDLHLTDVNNPHIVTKAQVGLSNVDNVKQYSETNPPPYPVTSVNGQTGAVSFTTEEWTFTLSDGSTVTKRVMLG